MRSTEKHLRSQRNNELQRALIKMGWRIRFSQVIVVNCIFNIQIMNVKIITLSLSLVQLLALQDPKYETEGFFLF